MASGASPKWSEIKKNLETMNSAMLVQLLKGVFDLSAENKLFLASQIAPQTITAATREPYRDRIVAQFFPKRGFGKLKLSEARQAIRDYRKATSDLAGTLDLMMTYVEQGTEFTCQYGDIEDSFYNSLESVLNEIATLLRGPGGDRLYALLRKRLQAVAEQSQQIGWGYGDNVREIVDALEADMENTSE